MKKALGVTLALFSLVAQSAGLPRSGSTTKITPNSATIDRSFIQQLRANPGATTQEWVRWGVTYAELGYFLLAGDENAVEATIQYVLHNQEHRDDYDDHYGIQELATLLSLSPRLDYVVAKANPADCKALAQYYINHKSDYVAEHNPPWNTEWCLKK